MAASPPARVTEETARRLRNFELRHKDIVCVRSGAIVPPALVLILAGIVKGTIDYAGQGHLGLFGIVLALTGLQMLFIGLLADLIDHRMKL